MSNFTNETSSRVTIEARIAKRRRAENGGNVSTMRDDDDYYLPTAKVKAQVEFMKWLCQG